MPLFPKHMFVRGLWIGLLSAVLALSLCAVAAAAQKLLNFPPTTFKIYNEAGTKVIGDGEYRIEAAKSTQANIHGENHYKNGEYDIEDDLLQLHSNGHWPTLISFKHAFYRPDGSTMLLASFEMKTGKASCVDNGPKGMKYNVSLKPPPNTYAGASLLVPISEALRAKNRGTIELHVFDCLPEPKIVALSAYATNLNQWRFYSGKLVQVEAKPDLGWLNILAAPFVPRVHAWFDPRQDYDYVGGQIHRYLYGKEHVILVKAEGDQKVAAKNMAPVSKANGAVPPPLDSPKK